MRLSTSLLSLLTTTTLVSANPHLPPRAVGDKCTTPDGDGTCKSTSDCKGWSDPGPLPGYCPNDPDDVQCCVEKTCQPPSGTGLCQNTYKACSGGYDADNLCPGDQSIQCCKGMSNPGDTSPAPTSAPAASPPTASEKPNILAPAPVGGSSTTNTGHCSHPQPDDCTFYTECVESLYQCGSSGYPLDYGYKYCNKFEAAKSRMDSNGKEWITATMLCLQNALVPYLSTPPPLSCSQLQDTAFDSHPGCYVHSGPGVCTLGPQDWEVIFTTVSPSDMFGSLEKIKEVLRTAADCAELYAWLIAQGFVKILQDAKNLWDKITSWL